MTSRKYKFKHLLVSLLAFLTFLTAAIFVYFTDPALFKYVPPCPFYYLTGLYCPGCGSLRALHALVHGNLILAAKYNIAFVAAIFYFAVDFVFWILSARYERIKPLSRMTRTPRIILLSILIYWIARNIPMYPLNLLAPTIN